ncbi:MAG: hypothetical protein ACOXZR_00165 [Bacilli bacterium]|jgi:hypothetical protein
MNNYVFGRQLAFSEVLKKKEEYATIFSEGNKHLKKLLNYCFDHNIETNLCCVGHNEEMPMYIKFNITRNKEEDIARIINAVENNRYVILDFSKRSNDDYASLWVKTYYLYQVDQIFEDLYQGLSKKEKNQKLNQSYLDILDIVKNFKHEDYDLTFKVKNYNDEKFYSLDIDYMKMKDDQIVYGQSILTKSINIEEGPYILNKKIDEQIKVSHKEKVKSLSY